MYLRSTECIVHGAGCTSSPGAQDAHATVSGSCSAATNVISFQLGFCGWPAFQRPVTGYEVTGQIMVLELATTVAKVEWTYYCTTA